MTLTAATTQALTRAAASIATTPEALAERILALVLQSVSMDKDERRAAFSAFVDLRGKLFVAGMPEEDA